MTSDLKSRLRKLKEDHNLFDNEYRRLLEEKNQIEAEISILKHKLESAEQTLKNLEDQKAKKQEQKLKCDQEIKELERQISEVSHVVEAQKNHLDKLKDEIEKMEKEHSNLTFMFTKEVEIVNKISEDIQNAERRLNTLIIEKNNLENQIGTIKEKYFDLFNEEIYLPDGEIVWSEKKKRRLKVSLQLLNSLDQSTFIQ